MAQSLSAKKRHRQNEKQRMINRQRRSELRTALRAFTDALAARDVDKATGAFRSFAKRVDQIAAKGTIHRNAAARRKSRAQQRLTQLRASGK